MARSDLIVLAVVMFCALLLDWGGLLGAAYAGSRAGARRNAWAGIRTRKLLANDDAWRVGHAEALRWAKSGVLWLLLPSAIVLFLVGSAPGVVATLETLFFAAGLVLLALTVRAAHRAVDSQGVAEVRT